MSLSAFNRKIHRWGAIVAFAPVLVVIVSGLLLLIKKEVAWIQPPSSTGVGNPPTLTLDRILEAARSAHEAEIDSWEDVDRIDVRPSKGIAKLRGHNRMEVQVDTNTGEVLQVALRRSDLIESIHDGSWFHDRAKFWVFLPSAVILFLLWLSGIYLWLLPRLRRGRRYRRGTAKSGVN